jgi:guanine nucleotide-binding protein subunit beta
MLPLQRGQQVGKRHRLLSQHYTTLTSCDRHAVSGSLDGKLIVWDCWTGNKIQVTPVLLINTMCDT